MSCNPSLQQMMCCLSDLWCQSCRHPAWHPERWWHWPPDTAPPVTSCWPGPHTGGLLWCKPLAQTGCPSTRGCSGERGGQENNTTLSSSFKSQTVCCCMFIVNQIIPSAPLHLHWQLPGRSAAAVWFAHWSLPPTGSQSLLLELCSDTSCEGGCLGTKENRCIPLIPAISSLFKDFYVVQNQQKGISTEQSDFK